MNAKNYENTFIRIARDVILQAAGIEMLKDLNKELRKAHALCLYLQLLNIELPANYEDSIVLTQKKMKQFEQEAALIRKEIEIMKSYTDQEINAINSTATADAYVIKQTAIANASNMTIDAESNDLQLSNNELYRYLFYSGLMGQPDSKLMVGLDNALLNINKA